MVAGRQFELGLMAYKEKYPIGRAVRIVPLERVTR